MNWFTGVVVYILVWWVTLFAVLPLWVMPIQRGDLGHDAGAPQNPRLLAKAALTTAIAAAIWVAIFIVVTEPWFSFRDS